MLVGRSLGWLVVCCSVVTLVGWLVAQSYASFVCCSAGVPVGEWAVELAGRLVRRFAGFVTISLKLELQLAASSRVRP